MKPNIIFDFNGVLLWDSHIHQKVWEEYTLKLRKTPLTHEELLEHFEGRSVKACLEYILKRKLTDTELKQLTAAREKRYRKLVKAMKDNFSLSPGAVALLDTLVTHNIPHTIATSAGKTNMRFFFEHLHLDKWFDFDSIVYDDGSLPSKPAPDIYQKAAKKLNADPKDCLVIEDAHSGVQAALSAGIGTVIALGSQTRLKEFPKVSYTIDSLGEMVPLVRKYRVTKKSKFIQNAYISSLQTNTIPSKISI